MVQLNIVERYILLHALQSFKRTFKAIDQPKATTSGRGVVHLWQKAAQFRHPPYNLCNTL